MKNCQTDLIFRKMANFAKIIPAVTDRSPPGILEVKYGDLERLTGNTMAPTEVKHEPTVVNWDAEAGKFYFLCFTDPDNATKEKIGTPSSQWYKIIKLLSFQNSFF